MAEAPPAQVRAIHELEEQGVEVKRFPEPVMTALQEAGGEVLAEEKQTNPDFAKAYDSQMKHAALIDEWYELQAMPQPMAR
ncbi:C4-dicarboxylate ABC transporter substrate-binding protein, partial [Cobetia sp. SIMBA_158]